MKATLLVLLLGATASCFNDEEFCPHGEVDARPNETSIVEVDMVLTSLNRLDSMEQELGTTFLLILTWIDQRLSWNSNSSNNSEAGCRVFRRNDIWTPTLMLTNAIEDSMALINENKLPLRVFSDGTVTWVPRISPTTTCLFDISTFPTDIQVCSINITSWVLTYDQLQLIQFYPGKHHPVDLDSYTKDNSWELIHTSVNITNHTGVYGLKYQNIMYSFHFRRFGRFYWVLIIIPGVCISFLMPFVFIINPVDSATRITYLTAMMMSLLFYSSVLTSLLPSVFKAGSEYIIGEFFGYTMVFGTTITIAVLISGIAASFIAKMHISDGPEVKWYCLGGKKCSRERYCKVFQFVNISLFVLALMIWIIGIGVFLKSFK